MKNFFRVTFFVSFFIFLSSPSFSGAQSTSTLPKLDLKSIDYSDHSKISQAEPVIVSNVEVNPLFISEVKTEKDTYNPGDVVNGVIYIL